MKRTVLGIEPALYQKKTNFKIALCVAVAIFVAVLNFIFVGVRTEENHYIMLALNILVDILGIWFLIYFISLKIYPRIRLLKLYNSKKTKHEGIIDEISDETDRVDSFDCYRVRIGERVFFLVSDAELQLSAGDNIVFLTVGNIIVETKGNEKN